MSARNQLFSCGARGESCLTHCIGALDYAVKTESMRTIQLKSHIGTDGILNVRVPVGLANTDVEVLLVFNTDFPKTIENGWPADFFVVAAIKSPPVLPAAELSARGWRRKRGCNKWQTR